MKVLIVGAGIAGATLAYWLCRSGHQPTLLERAPRLREGGYLVDFWGAGFEVADRMGIVPILMERGYRIGELREISPGGRRLAGLDTVRLMDAMGGRYVSITRSDLAAAIYQALGGQVETVFGTTVQALADQGDLVRVRFADGIERDFDLVVGADGLHSRIRSLAFGPESELERDLGVAIAVFDIAGYRPREELVAVTHTQVGVQTLRVALREDTTMFCLTFRHDGDVPGDRAAGERLVHARLSGSGGELPAILDRMSQARTFFLDRASQIRLPSWWRGRIALVGDAAAAPSFLAGQGSALAMVEAYVLASELVRTGGDHRAAFAGYERQLLPMVRAKQDAAAGMGDFFAPRNRRRLALRTAAIRVLGFPPIASLLIGRSLRDPIRLPADVGAPPVSGG